MFGSGSGGSGGGFLSALNDAADSFWAQLDDLDKQFGSFVVAETAEQQQDDDAESTEEGRGQTDQIVAFFEREYDGREEAFAPFVDDADALDALRTSYFNCTTCIDHQDDQIVHLLTELQAKRRHFKELLLRSPSALRLGRVTAQAVMEINAMEGSKALLREIEVLKMDVTDRKTTRFFKEKERQEAVTPLAQMISEIKLREYVRRSAAAGQADERQDDDDGSAWGAPASKKDDGESTSADGNDDARAVEGQAGSPRAGISADSVRRRRKRYTDAEINSLLKEKLF